MIDVKKSIELLRDDKNYYGEFGRNFMSNTDVKMLIDDPANFKQGSIDQENLAKGRLTHTLLFEPHKAHSLQLSSAADRRVKQYKEDLERSGQQYLLLQKDFEEMAFLVSRVKENERVYNLLFGPGYKYEEPNIMAYRGLYWKTKADSLGDVVVDFKTTGDLSRFKWAAKEYCYDSQAFLYSRSYGKPVVFVVAEKGSGRLGVFECGTDFLESGLSKVKLALENYDRFWNPDTRTEDASNYFIKDTL
jgi:hypothetical protein